MKKILLLVLAAMIMLPCAAQRAGLVKDEDGYTNIRKGPGTNYEIVDQVPDGMFINFGPGKGNWYKVYTSYTDGSAQELIGYMHSSKVVVPKRQGEWKQVGQVVIHPDGHFPWVYECQENSAHRIAEFLDSYFWSCKSSGVQEFIQ